MQELPRRLWSFGNRGRRENPSPGRRSAVSNHRGDAFQRFGSSATHLLSEANSVFHEKKGGGVMGLSSGGRSGRRVKGTNLAQGIRGLLTVWIAVQLNVDE